MFERVTPGLYRVFKPGELSYDFEAGSQQEEDGRWSSWIDALPGCAAWGYSQEEALDALKDAAQVYIGDMMDAGEELSTKGVEVIEAPVVTVRV